MNFKLELTSLINFNQKINKKFLLLKTQQNRFIKKKNSFSRVISTKSERKKNINKIRPRSKAIKPFNLMHLDFYMTLHSIINTEMLYNLAKKDQTKSNIFYR